MDKLLDANAILRYLLNDNENQAKMTQDIIEHGAFTIGEVIAEVVYVLQGVYCLQRFTISDGLRSFLNEINIQDKPVIKKALEIFAQNNIDYVDSLLVSRKELLNDDVFTFDKKLNKLL